MEKRMRKLVRVGQSSLAIILPKPWLDYYDLSYGDRLEVVSNDEIQIRRIERDEDREEGKP